MAPIGQWERQALDRQLELVKLQLQQSQLQDKLHNLDLQAAGSSRTSGTRSRTNGPPQPHQRRASQVQRCDSQKGWQCMRSACEAAQKRQPTYTKPHCFKCGADKGAAMSPPESARVKQVQFPTRRVTTQAAPPPPAKAEAGEVSRRAL